MTLKHDSEPPDEEPFLRSANDPEQLELQSSFCCQPLLNKFAVIHIVVLVLNVILAIGLFFFIQVLDQYPDTHGMLEVLTIDSNANILLT